MDLYSQYRIFEWSNVSHHYLIVITICIAIVNFINPQLPGHYVFESSVGALSSPSIWIFSVHLLPTVRPFDISNKKICFKNWNEISATLPRDQWVAHISSFIFTITLQWRHNEYDGVSLHQPHDCFFNRLFKRRSKKTSKRGRTTGLYAGNSAVTGEFPAQKASNAENASIWWRHHDTSTVS